MATSFSDDLVANFFKYFNGLLGGNRRQFWHNQKVIVWMLNSFG